VRTSGANNQRNNFQGSFPPPPPIYGSPVNRFPMGPNMNVELKTEKGMKYFSWFLLISMITSGISILSQIIQTVALMSADPLAMLCFNGVLSLGVFALGITGLVFFIMALVILFQGKEEFGPEHARFVKIAIILVFVQIGLVVFMIITSVALLFVLFATLTPGGNLSLLAPGLIAFIVILSVIGIALAILNYVMIYMLVAKVAIPEDLLKIKIGIGISVGATLVFIAPTILLALIPNASLLSLGLTIMRSLIQIGVQFLFYLAYKNTYEGIKNGLIIPMTNNRVRGPYSREQRGFS
jgi:hypothetical protein